MKEIKNSNKTKLNLFLNKKIKKSNKINKEVKKNEIKSDGKLNKGSDNRSN